jgi:very-short-patch-repair endonuclease
LAYARPTVVGDHRDGVALEEPMTALIRAWLATGATLCGSSAAIFGSKWLVPSAPAEVIRADRHAPPGIVAYTWELAPAEVCRVRGVGVTTPARTAFDIGRTRPDDQAVAAVDALLNATRITPREVVAVADAHPGARGVARLRGVLDLVDGGAESPQETKVRLLIVRGGLPRPETQIEFPTLHIRVDMGWRQWKVAVEYDGVQHWTDSRQRAWDIERIALLEAAGWVVIRVSGGMLARPDAILDRIRRTLRARGCPV